jgi:3-hydroxyacyl-[acyl-carrier-protein] dehydratase
MEKALSLLPHGPEFRFLDRLTALEPGRTGRAEYKIRGDEPCLRGHFPGEPIFPGVLLVEAAAQLAGVVAQSDPAILPLAGLKLAALRQVKILGAAKPGETLELEARITGRMGHLIQAQASARVSGVMVMMGELTLAGSDRPAGHFADDYGSDKERAALEKAMGTVQQKPER